MKRGTTPSIRFTLPFNSNIFNSLYITFKQNDILILEKTKDDCSLVDNTIILMLSQEDTLLFSDKIKIEIQIRGKTANDQALASDIMTTTIGRILKRGVI